MKAKLTLSVAALGGALLTTAPAFAQQAITADQLIGSWKVVSLIDRNVDTGKAVAPMSDHPVGYVIFAKDGGKLRAVFFIRVSDWKKTAGTLPTDAEAAALYKGLEFFSAIIDLGKATADGTAYTQNVDVAWNPGFEGTHVKQVISLKGDTLVATSLPFTSLLVGPHTVAVTTLIKDQ